MDKKLRLFLIILFTFVFLTRFSLSIFSPLKFWDETIYVNLGRNIILFGEYSFSHGFSDFAPNMPLAGFRPPLLPFLIAFLSLFTFNTIILSFLMSIISALGVIAFFFLVYVMFNKNIAIYSSLLLSVLPLYVFWGSKILTDSLFITFILLSSFLFWKLFFVKKSGLFAFLFGLSCALAFYSRYSFIWFIPVFFLSLLFKDRNLKFLEDKHLWISIIIFFVFVGPWFIYNYFEYGSLLGFLFQSKQALARWGVDSLFNYYKDVKENIIILLPFVFLGLFYKANNNKNNKKNSVDKINKINKNKLNNNNNNNKDINGHTEKNAKSFWILWFIIISLFLIFLDNKEGRYLLPLLPSICVLASLGLNNIKIRKYSYYFLLVIILFFVVVNFFIFLNAFQEFQYKDENCFFKTMNYLKNSDANYVITEHFSPSYFYTSKPSIRADNYTSIEYLLKNVYQNDTIFYYYVDGDWFNLKKEELKTENFLIYSCEDQEIYDLSSINLAE